MLNVDKNYCTSAYIDTYWKNNLIIDSNLTKINTNLHMKDKPYEIEKTLNKNIENKHNKNTYKDNRVYNNNYHNSYNIRQNTYQNNNQQNTYQNNNQQNTYQNKNNYTNKKNKEYTLPIKQRCKEYNLGERKILLEAFSKPKLL